MIGAVLNSAAAVSALYGFKLLHAQTLVTIQKETGIPELLLGQPSTPCPQCGRKVHKVGHLTCEGCGVPLG